MMRILFCTFMSVLHAYAFAQSVTGTPDTSEYSNELKKRFYRYKILYSKKAMENHIDGTVIVQFDIDSTCFLVNRTVKQSLGYGCDEQVLLVLDKLARDMKKDNKMKCKTVTRLELPVRFKLGD